MYRHIPVSCAGRPFIANAECQLHAAPLRPTGDLCIAPSPLSPRHVASRYSIGALRFAKEGGKKSRKKFRKKKYPTEELTTKKVAITKHSCTHISERPTRVQNVIQSIAINAKLDADHFAFVRAPINNYLIHTWYGRRLFNAA